MPIWLLPLFGTIASKIIGIVIDYFWDSKCSKDSARSREASSALERKLYPLIERELKKRQNNE